MAVNNATGYNRTTREPLDALYLNSGSAYTSIAAVNAAVNINVRYTGSMFNVNGDLYWYKEGVQDSDLVIFTDLHSFATTQSFQQFTQSVHMYTQSNNVRVSDIYISESNYLPTASFLPISSSFDVRVLANSASIYSLSHNSGSLATLTDVVLNTLTPGQALVYDTGTTKWKNASYISASVSGNAGTVTDGVYTVGAQTIAGQKTLTTNPRVVNLDAGISLYDATKGFSLATFVSGVDRHFAINYDSAYGVIGTNVFTATNTGQIYLPSLAAGGMVISSTFGLLSVSSGTGFVKMTGTTLSYDNSVILASHYIVDEVPTGTIDGINANFVVANTPITGKQMVFVNGVKLEAGLTSDYTISGANITFNAGAIPEIDDKLTITYIY